MSRVGLMMIVKDEAHVIRACLESVRPFIDWWVVVDTGSSDRTQEIVREVLADLPGEVVDRPWVNFGHNRQEALDLARASSYRTSGDYALWIDADEQLREVPGVRPGLTHDGYHLGVAYAGTRYSRLALVALDRPWRWVGPIHEYLDLPGAHLGELTAPTVWVEHTGARSRDPDVYRKDAALIEAALEDEPGNPRLQFYLAQSWRDAGEPERALECYEVRAANADGWDQERWHALFQIAVMHERIGSAPGIVVEAYLTAYDACPWRAEPLVELARYERQRERFESAWLFADRATRIPMPGHEGLFVDAAVYEWRSWDELAVSCYWTARYAEGARAATEALKARPDDPRLQDNLSWCRQGLAASDQSASRS